MSVQDKKSNKCSKKYLGRNLRGKTTEKRDRKNRTIENKNPVIFHNIRNDLITI